MDVIQILATIFSLIGAICMIWGGIAKDVRRTHQIQVMDCSANTLATILLQSWPGSLANFTALVREIIASRGTMTRTKQLLLCGFMILFGVLFNNKGIFGYFPIVGSALYVMIGCRPDASFTTLKGIIAINMSLWAIHDFVIGAYPTAIADVLTVIMCCWAIVKHIHKNENTNINKNEKKDIRT